MEDGMERFMVSLPQGHPARRFLAELEGEGIQVRELEKFQEGEDDTAFEGKPFKASNNFVYDSLAAWYITRWSHASALSARRSQRRNRIDQLLDELAELPHHDVVNASPGMLADAVAFTLEDGSRVIAIWPEKDPETAGIFRLTGETREGCACWLDWGFDPPVASSRVPLPADRGR